eukprot:2958405-Amphidinium_carterae.3
MIFGSPEVITMDGERGLHSLYVADWAEANNVQMRFRAPHQHAWIVERHNAVLRTSLHRMESQCQDEGRRPHLSTIVSLAVHMKSSPRSMATPRIRQFLADPAASNERLREIAVSCITEATAKERISRANRHPSTPTITDESYKHGDLVDIWLEPTDKDQSGWRGPAKVMQCLPAEGAVVSKWQGAAKAECWSEELRKSGLT